MATAVTLAHDEDPSYEEMLATLKKMHAAARKERVAKPLEARVAQLDKLEQTLLRNKDAICRAVSADFGHRSKHETLLAEVFITLSTLKYAREHLAEWMAPEERDVNFTFFPARAELVAQPLGVVGIISPWNYPLQLALAPLVGALAAGNRAIIKPSEFVPETAALLKRLVSDTFAHDEVAVVTGGPRVGQDFSRLPFDHLIFTGSTQVGKLVMKAAAENLTPVTLELGGKSPVIVGPGFPIEVAAERILHGKLLNAGQTCIAPDYVLLPKGKADAFVEACRAAIARMYPKLVGNDDYTSIISDRHIARLKAHLEDAEGKGGKLAELNPAKEDFDADTRKMAPVLVLHPKDDMTVMQEEIFGPVLPLRTYDSLDEAIDYVNDHPRPLALYVFDHDDANVRRIVDETVAGGVTVNETMIHIAQDSLPFGGVGPSGLGHYHGHEGFLAMSKMKPVVYQSRLNATGLMRPPYGGKIDFVLKMLIGK